MPRAKKFYSRATWGTRAITELFQAKLVAGTVY
jgi:hypothetical protein